MKKLSVAKFGGTSVADYQAMQACANIIVNNSNISVVVLSASAGVTNHLVKLANGCDNQILDETIDAIKTIEFNIIDKLKNNTQISEKINKILAKIQELSFAAKLASSPSPMLIDEIISYGEIMSTLIFIEVLKEYNTNAVWIDARDIVITDDNFGGANPNGILTKANSDKILKPLLDDNAIIITQGFIGKTESNKTSTLGRGGSDYSAALFAEILNADDVLIWTDVAGIYTTDPRIVPNAKKLESISFSEASEMATFGAKVLHPSTLLPAVRQNIPVYVGSTKEPELGGTWVVQNPDTKPTIRAIATRKNQTLLTLKSLNMLHQYGFLHKVFEIISEYKISIDTVSTSEVSISLTIDKTGSVMDGKELLPKALLEKLKSMCSVTIETGFSLVALIGNELHEKSGIETEIFKPLNNYPIRLISCGASSHNICLLVKNEDANPIVQILHKQFFEK